MKDGNWEMTRGLKVTMVAFAIFMVTLAIPGTLGIVIGFASGLAGLVGILSHNAERGRKSRDE